MDELFPDALHRAILGVDVEGFADRRRTNPDQMMVRDGLYRCLQVAFAGSGIAWDLCYCEDRGDGALILVPPEIPKSVLVSRFPQELSVALRAHNQAHAAGSRIRVRLAVHGGEVHHDGHGVTGTAVNVTFRLLEAAGLKQALRSSPGLVALIASDWFYQEVIRHTPASRPNRYRQVRVRVKETDELAWITLPDGPHTVLADSAAESVAPSAEVPRQLPAAISCFAGRRAELERLTALLDDSTTPGNALLITAVDGMPGIGKTTLALQWAHQVADHFPDGQLYVNLRGFDPGSRPVAAARAIRGFLDGLGVSVRQIPRYLDAQASLYRSRLAGRRMLIVLDNARDAEQVRPLLPGSPKCLVVITSRNKLTSLIISGAHSLTLGLPSDAEAHQLLGRRLGRDRLEAEPDSARHIVGLCGRLPLALSIAAARAVTHPGFSLATLAAELRGAGESLEAFDDGDPAASASAVISWSYHQLSPAAARMYRSLGTHPGPDITVSAAASLAATTSTEARAALAELARANLITEPIAGRFAFHDLLRSHATEKAVQHERAHAQHDERRASAHRVLDYYLHAAMTASSRFSPGRSPLPLTGPQPGVLPAEMTDKDQAMAWFDAELPVLLALTSYADASGFDTHAWQIPWTLGPYFSRRGKWRDYAATQQIALAAATRLGDRLALAHAHYLLGHALAETGGYDAADPHVRQALDLFRGTGDRANEAYVLNGLAGMLEKQQRFPEALAVALEALRMLRAVGHWWTQATLENGVGWLYAHLGQYDQALTHCQKALALHRESGHRGGAADTLDSLGYVYLHLGDTAKAKAHYMRAIDAYREIASQFGQGNSLTGLGDVQLAEGQAAAARKSWNQAIVILSELPSHDITQLELKLAKLRTQPAPADVHELMPPPG
jgi:tetratricopeptide (TPR) repeat protein